MSELYIGQQLKLKPSCFSGHDNYTPTKRINRPCTVVYINRKHRFFRVLFKFESGGSFYESYKF